MKLRPLASRTTPGYPPKRPRGRARRLAAALCASAALSLGAAGCAGAAGDEEVARLPGAVPMDVDPGGGTVEHKPPEADPGWTVIKPPEEPAIPEVQIRTAGVPMRVTPP